MGNPKQKWTSEEEGALRAGVEKHGIGKWKNILKDPEFGPFLVNRSNIDLKDKWRNLSISTGQIPKDKFKAPRVRPNTTDARPIAPETSASLSVVIIVDDAADDPSKSSQEEKNVPYPRYNSMILEAIGSMKDPNGSDIGAILRYIEQQHPVPQNFRRLLSSKLRRLVLQGKLEKIQNCFKIKVESVGAKHPTLDEKDAQQGPSQNSGSVASIEKLLNTAQTVACQVAEAENKSFVAAEAAKELERIVKMSEDTDSMLQIVKFIHYQCSKGERIIF